MHMQMHIMHIKQMQMHSEANAYYITIGELQNN